MFTEVNNALASNDEYEWQVAGVWRCNVAPPHKHISNRIIEVNGLNIWWLIITHNGLITCLPVCMDTYCKDI